MGRKYASIHIRTDEAEEVLLKLRNNYIKDNSMNKTARLALNALNNTEARQMMERFSALLVNEVIIVQSEAFVSIYDESLSFETIGKKAKKLSTCINRPILYTSNFDDIFIFGIFQSGKLITESKNGEDLMVYGINPKKLDIDKFCNTLKINRNNALEHLNSTEGIHVIEQALEKYLEIPLKLSISDIQSSKEHFVEIFIENGLYGYKSFDRAYPYR